MFKNANEFSTHIEQLAVDKGISYTEAILLYCEENMLEIDEVAPMVSSSLKEKIAVEFRKDGMLPPQPTLEQFI